MRSYQSVGAALVPWFCTVQETSILLPTVPVAGTEALETIKSGAVKLIATAARLLFSLISP